MNLNTIRLSGLIAFVFVALLSNQLSQAMDVPSKWNSRRVFVNNPTAKILKFTPDSKPDLWKYVEEGKNSLFAPFSINNDPNTKNNFPYTLSYTITEHDGMGTYIRNIGTVTFLFSMQKVHIILNLGLTHKTFDFDFDDLKNLEFIIVLAGANFEDSMVQANLTEAAIEKAKLEQQRLGIEQQRLQGRPAETTIEKLLELKRK